MAKVEALEEELVELKLKKRKSNSRKSIDSISVQSKRRSSGI